MDQQPIAPEQFNHLVKSRRSVFLKQFMKGEQVPDKIIWQLLENANWAPTHKHTAPWRFCVFTGEGLKKLASFQAALYKKNAGQHFKPDKYEKMQNNPLQCSHVISIGMKRSSEANIPEMEEIAAVACAVENIYLTAAVYGIGGYWTTGGITYETGAKEFFGLSGEDKLLGFFYLGYIGTPSIAGKREPIANKTTWVDG
ncbi:MAG: nitroreductase [Bacteroidetes bacterium]|nr:nitroreductase [Bacteroidota bacterium]